MTIEKQMRESIAGFLLCALENAVMSYQVFSECVPTAGGEDVEAKKFKAHHDACKSVLTHIKFLIELAQWIGSLETNIEDGDRHEMLQNMIENAEKELKSTDNV